VKNKQLLKDKKQYIRRITAFGIFVIAVMGIYFNPLYNYTGELTGSKTDKSHIIIAIDVGHSKTDPGAISSRGIAEYYFNLNLARLLYAELIAQGYKPFIINENGDNIKLIDRAGIAEKKFAQLLISIHHDSVQQNFLKSWIYNKKKYLYSDLYSGYSVFYSNSNRFAVNSLEFAKILASTLKRSGFIPTLHHAEVIKGENRNLISRDLGIYRVDDFVIIKRPKIPSVIIESGIIVNRDEEFLLSNKVYQKALINSLIKSIDLYENMNR